MGKVIGVGAAGNKAAINAIERNIVSKNDVLLLNTTPKDVKPEYKDIFIQLKSPDGFIGGAGQERPKGKEAAYFTLSEMDENKNNIFDSFLDPKDNYVVIVFSAEGGTGCGAGVVLANYFKTVLKQHVHVFTFTGFEDDPRKLRNTVELFQEINPECTVQVVSNKRFLNTDGIYNKISAERAANETFAQKLNILLGQTIVESDQNIDERDLFKLTTWPGYMQIEHIDISNIKNTNDFNEAVTNALDYSKALEVSTLSAKNLGVIFNIPEKFYDRVDFNIEVVKARLGVPYEFYIHIQKVDDEDWVQFISSGMQMPLNEVEAIFEKYKKASSSVNKDMDRFIEIVGGYRGNNEDIMFDRGEYKENTSPSRSDKKEFFHNYKSSIKSNSIIIQEDDKDSDIRKLSSKDEF